MEEYNTIIDEVEAEIQEKKSKFIANMFHVESIEEAEQKIKDIKKKYYDAKHHCIAYRVIQDGQLVEKSSDDGEPSGTAGAPMLNILKKSEICNVVVIVTRYFGGILLGTGGLVRAYSEAVQNAISKSILAKKVEGVVFEIELEYSNLEIFKYYCQKNDINIISTNYMDNIVLKVQLEKIRKKVFLEDVETKKLKIKSIKEFEERYIDKIFKN